MASGVGSKIGLGSLKGPQGDRGLTGPKGPEGRKGDQGIQGIRGPKGDPGPKGDRGDLGYQGPRGPQGEEGPRGLKGDAGPQGPQGATGPQGEKGARGEVGPAGLTWHDLWRFDADYIKNDAVYYDGASWFAKEDPPVGDVPRQSSSFWTPLSIRGPEGRQGPQGIQGVQGNKGDTGDQGPQGIQGIQGPQGLQGIQGPQGIKGDLAETYDLGSANGNLDLSSYTDGGVFLLILTGNITGVILPSTLMDKQRVFELIIRQDAVGSRSITWPTVWLSSFGLKPMLSTKANATDRVAIIQSPLINPEIRLVSRELA